MDLLRARKITGKLDFSIVGKIGLGYGRLVALSEMRTERHLF